MFAGLKWYVVRLINLKEMSFTSESATTIAKAFTMDINHDSQLQINYCNNSKPI